MPVLPGALFKNGLFQKKTNRGVEDILFSFLKKTLELLIFLLYLWKFQTKQSSTPKLHKIVLWKFQGQRWRPPSPLEISHDFFLVTLLEIPPNPLFGFFLFLLFSCPIETSGVHNNKQIRRNKQIQMDKELKEFNFKIPCTHTAQYNSIFSRNVDHPKIYLLFYSFRCPLAS